VVSWADTVPAAMARIKTAIPDFKYEVFIKTVCDEKIWFLI
jgi:hypothetical protein